MSPTAAFLWLCLVFISLLVYAVSVLPENAVVWIIGIMVGIITVEAIRTLWRSIN